MSVTPPPSSPDLPPPVPPTLAQPSKPPSDSSRYEWMIRAWPEYGLLPDDAARKEVLGQLQQSHFVCNPFFYLYVIAVVVVGIAAVPMIHAMSLRLGGWVRLPHWVFAAGSLIAFIAIYYVGIGIFWDRSVRNRLRQLIRERGIAICVACGYDCRGIESERCPECGKALRRQNAE
ncbi:MAG: hypothetical protein ACKVS9_11495 [Phycisphaerae bacterium]